jgi:hypothetical protein
MGHKIKIQWCAGSHFKMKKSFNQRLNYFAVNLKLRDTIYFYHNNKLHPFNLLKVRMELYLRTMKQKKFSLIMNRLQKIRKKLMN